MFTKWKQKKIELVARPVVEPADEEDEYSLKEVINNTDCKEQSR